MNLSEILRNKLKLPASQDQAAPPPESPRRFTLLQQNKYVEVTRQVQDPKKLVLLPIQICASNFGLNAEHISPQMESSVRLKLDLLGRRYENNTPIAESG